MAVPVKIRVKKHRERKRAEGKQCFSIMLSEEAVRMLKKKKKEGLGKNYEELIEKAIRLL